MRWPAAERLRRMRQQIDAGLIGAAGPRQVTSAFTFRGAAEFHRDNIRVKAEADPLGCLGDLGPEPQPSGRQRVGAASELSASAIVTTVAGVPRHSTEFNGRGWRAALVGITSA